MDKFLTMIGIKFLSAKLDGHKTTLGSVGLVLLGLYTIVNTMASDAPSTDEIMTGVGYISTGLAAFGIGHKVEKINT